MLDVRKLLTGGRVMPILTIADPAHAGPLAKALAAGGITVCEVTLRTPAALEAIREMRSAAPGLITGAGTIRTARDIENAVEAGAQFLVTPGTTRDLAHALAECAVPALPGAATASEVLALVELGFDTLKFFPAEQAGGAPMLKALYPPLPDISFCPTGGVSTENVGAYLALPNVLCAGGSWIAPEAALKAGDWAGIEARARATRG
jgi:2-dehydro-3-deoxyphosphogluconate aldolase/(4S)-4-hydroxy-2-oxoglutarate aldolase